MWTRFRQLLAAPEFDDDEKKRAADLLRIILPVLSIALVIPAVFTLHPQTILITVGMAIIFLSLWLILHRGYVKVVSRALVTTLLMGISLTIYQSGTIHIPAASAFVVCILVASLTLGNRAAIRTTVTASIILFVLYRAETVEMLPERYYETTGLLQWFAYTGVMTTTAILLILANHSTLRTLELTKKNAWALNDHNRKLLKEISEYRQTEKALRESEERYRTLVEMESDAIILIDVETFQILDANPAALQLYGYTHHEMLSLQGMSLSHELNDTIPIITPSAQITHIPLRYHHNKKGVVFPVEITGRFFSRKEKNFLLVAIRDITERIKVDEALKASEQKFSLAFQHNPALMAISNVEDGTLFDVNETFLRKLGFSREEVIGHTTRELNLWSNSKDREETIAKLVEDGYVQDIEIVMQTKEKSQLTLLFSVEYFSIEEKRFLLTIGYDITKRKQTEQTLSHYAERLTILRQIDQAILRAQSVEAIAQDILEHVRKLFPGTHISVIEFKLPKDEFTIIAAHNTQPTKLSSGKKYPIKDITPLENTFRSGEAYVVDDIHTPPFATEINKTLEMEGIISFISLPMLVQDELIGSLNFGADRPQAFSSEQIESAQDIANLLAIAIQQARLYQKTKNHAQELEERVLERTSQLMAANQELESFSYSVAHDLRSPLRAVNGFSHMLLEDCADQLDKQAHSYIDHILTANQRMSQLIDDLLNLSHLTRSELVRASVDLSKLANTIVKELQQRDPQRNVEFVITNNLQAKADPRLIRVVLENLLGNAWKFTSKTPKAHIEFGTLPEEKDTYFIRDNGIGFDMTYANKLFGAFQRLHTEDEFPGTGIGLATVKRIIHRHGGEVWATGTINEGATFFFTIEKS